MRRTEPRGYLFAVRAGRLLGAVLALSLLISPPESSVAADTVSEPDSTVTSTGHVSMVLDGAGNPVISHVDGSGRLRIVHCNDPACAGNNESRTTPDSAGPFTHTSIVLAGANPVVAYRGGASSELRLLRCNDPNCSGNNDPVTTLGGAAPGSVTLALDGQGFPVIAFRATDNGIRLLRCNDAACAGGNESLTQPVGGDHPGTATHSSMMLDALDRPAIALNDGANLILRVVRCNDATCNPKLASASTPDAANEGRFNALRLDGAGLPVLAYQGATGLTVLRCADAACDQAASIEVPDQRPGISSVSLRLDTAGNPVVSYVVEGGQTPGLHLLHCNDAACAGGDDIARPVGRAAAPGSTALALDALGRPVVTYVAAGALRVLDCDDPACDSSSEPGIASITGVVRTAAPVAGALVQACRGQAPCATSITNASGSYSLTGLAADTYEVTVSAPGNLFPPLRRIALAPGSARVEDFLLAAPVLPPSGVTVDAPRSQLGTPVAQLDAPFTVSMTTCAGGVAEYRLSQAGLLLQSGPLSPAGPAALAAQVTPGVLGGATMRLILDCTDPAQDRDVSFDLYVEPASYVRTTGGAAIAGAAVTLHRAASEGGPFAPVPDGSVLLLPSNRANPQSAAQDGSFSWLPTTGFYFVRATAPGCHAPGNTETSHVDSAVFALPPEPPALDLRLACTDTDSDGDGYTDADELRLGHDPQTFCAVMRADIDNSEQVTIVDLGQVAGNFGRIAPAFDTRLDQNGDNQIDLIDIAAVAGVFGVSIDGCP